MTYGQGMEAGNKRNIDDTRRKIDTREISSLQLIDDNGVSFHELANGFGIRRREQNELFLKAMSGDGTVMLYERIINLQDMRDVLNLHDDVYARLKRSTRVGVVWVGGELHVSPPEPFVKEIEVIIHERREFSVTYFDQGETMHVRCKIWQTTHKDGSIREVKFEIEPRTNYRHKLKYAPHSSAIQGSTVFNWRGK